MGRAWFQSTCGGTLVDTHLSWTRLYFKKPMQKKGAPLQKPLDLQHAWLVVFFWKIRGCDLKESRLTVVSELRPSLLLVSGHPKKARSQSQKALQSMSTIVNGRVNIWTTSNLLLATDPRRLSGDSSCRQRIQSQITLTIPGRCSACALLQGIPANLETATLERTSFT